jgi:ribonuclease BN (tRNA processing enzyme)
MDTTFTISFLGTGSGIPSADRFFSSTLLHFEEKHLLIDAGEPCVHLLLDRGNLLKEISAILITHGHVDHIGGLPALLQGCKLLGRTQPLSIYLPEEMIAPLRTWISALYLPEEGIGFSLQWIAWKNGEGASLQENISVTPTRNRHLDLCYHNRPGADPLRPCDSYSLEICVAERRLIFSGDLGSPNDLAPLLGKPMDLLICELSHFSSNELAVALKGSTVGTLCLVHLSEEYAQDRSELKMQLEELLPKISDVVLPEDGEVLDF